MNKIFLILLFLFVKICVGSAQFFTDKLQVSFGTSYSTQQVKWYEEQQNQTNPFVRNSPNWRLLYNVGINYKIWKYQNIDFWAGIKFQEKGSKNILLNPFFPHYFEKKYEVTKYLMVSTAIVYTVHKNISIFAESTFGRQILNPYLNHQNEFAFITGLKCKVYKKIGFLIGFNQGITRLQQEGANFKVRNISLDTNITYDF